MIHIVSISPLINVKQNIPKDQFKSLHHMNTPMNPVYVIIPSGVTDFSFHLSSAKPIDLFIQGPRDSKVFVSLPDNVERVYVQGNVKTDRSCKPFWYKNSLAPHEWNLLTQPKEVPIGPCVAVIEDTEFPKIAKSRIVITDDEIMELRTLSLCLDNFVDHVANDVKKAIIQLSQAGSLESGFTFNYNAPEHINAKDVVDELKHMFPDCLHVRSTSNKIIIQDNWSN